MADASALAGNVDRYLHLQTARSALFWMPVFFLRFLEALPLEQVLLLEAVYYVAVVVLEVPTGVVADRWGRRPALLLATASTALGCALLAVATAWPVFVVGQVLLAVGMAAMSGADSAFLYDTLVALDATDRHGALEAEAQRRGLVATAVAALVGGIAGAIDLRWGHGLTALSSTVAFALAWGLVEPPAHDEATVDGDSLWRHATRPELRWLLAVGSVTLVLIHVPYEAYQPLVARTVDATPALAGVPAPVLTGLLTAAIAAVGAAAASRAAAWHAAWGTATTLLGGVAAAVALIAALGATLHPAILVVLLARSVPGAVILPSIRAAAHPRLPRRLRATWLSVQSFVGRLGFSATLTAASWAAVTGDDVQTLLEGAAMMGLVALVALALSVPAGLRRPREGSTSGSLPHP